MDESNYLTFLGCVPFLPIEDADSAYVAFLKFLNKLIPPKNMAVLMGGRSKVEPLGDQSGIADEMKRSIPH